MSRLGDEVIAIDSVPVSGSTGKSASHDVLVVFASGHVVCLSSDLETARWDAEAGKPSLLVDPTKGQEVVRTEYVTVTTAKAAIGGLLRSRQDVAAILDPSFEGDSDILALTTVLCAVFQLSDQRRVLCLFHIQSRSPDLITSHLLPLKHLLTWELPSVSASALPATDSAERLYYLHSASGILHELRNNHLLSYDFSGTVPKLYSDFHVPGSDLGSYLRISPDVVLSTAGKSLGIFDVKYASVQSLLPLGQSSPSENESKKRKQPDSETSSASDAIPTLISYFSEIGLAVGISNHEIVGVQIAETVARKRIKTNDTLLINAIGKGITSAPPTVTQESAAASESIALVKGMHKKEDWQKRVHKLDKYASKGKVADFEKSFAAHLGIELSEPTSASAAHDTLPNGTAEPLLTNGVSESAPSSNTDPLSEHVSGEELRKWQLPNAIPDSQRSSYRHSAMYALRKIFRYVKPVPSKNESRQSPLRVDFFPPNVFQWLLLSGYVTKESIRRSIQEDSPDDLNVAASIVDGDIVEAIVQFDPELHILSAVLNHGHFLPIGEVVQAIRVLMRSLDDRPAPDTKVRLLTNGDGPSEDTMDVELDSELDAATHDLDHAMSMLDNGLHIRSFNLRPALIRLHTFPAPVVSSTLRSVLPRRELESLIRLLHSELKNGGWTSPYDFLESENPEDPDDQAVAVIASLLSCALDAIGAGAWLAAIGDPASEESSEDIIHDLLQDTSEALNGFWEARFMRGLLSEFLRYSSNLHKSRKPTKESLELQGKPFAPDFAADKALPMLPLGGKVDLGVEKSKPGKGGKREQRSAREIGMLISKRVPKYSFEKIVI